MSEPVLVDPGESGGDWFSLRYQFIPPPHFVSVNGPTYQKVAGLVRYVPGKFSREIKRIGTFAIGLLGYAAHETPSDIIEMSRGLTVAVCPDGYGDLCLLFQCSHTESPDIWYCLKPVKE
jgi:hypothetical protein